MKSDQRSTNTEETTTIPRSQAPPGNAVREAPPRAFAVALVLLALLGGCNRLPPPSEPPLETGNSQAPASLESIAESLRKGSDRAACRNVLLQLNASLERHPEQKCATLTDAQQAFLRQMLRLDDDELHEVRSTSYTLLDAHHLEQCFLLHDAAESLQLAGCSGEVRAAAAFAWVVRQVRLMDEKEDLLPPLPVLRLGGGTDVQRSLVFLALLEQLDVPGCMIAMPGLELYWFPGALVGGEILLFDPRLGVPVPGPDGRGIATLSQMRSRPEVLKRLQEFNYKFTFEQARRGELHLICSLSALAPRMRQLQQLLATSSQVRLSQDAEQLLGKYHKAIQGPAMQGTGVLFWSFPGHPFSPSRLLRTFLPPEEGGADETRRRQEHFEMKLTPWSALPPPVRDIPQTVDLGYRLRSEFEQLFLVFFLVPGQPRDLMLRGRLADAVARLVETQDKLHHYLALKGEQPDIDKDFATWIAEAKKAQEEWLVARRKAENSKTPAALKALEEAQDRINELWKSWPKVQPALIAPAAGPLASEASYFLALAKHEQAEQIQARLDCNPDRPAELIQGARDAWQSASEKWRQYLEMTPTGPSHAAARIGLGRALESMGQRKAALHELDPSVARLTGWSREAINYRAKQLKLP